MLLQNPFQDIAERLARIENCLSALKQFADKLAATSTGEQPDKCSLHQALTYLREQGYPISKSKLYKLTAVNQIPHQRFSNRLVFSRKALLRWVESQTTERRDPNSIASLTLAASAKRKQKGGGRA